VAYTGYWLYDKSTLWKLLSKKGSINVSAMRHLANSSSSISGITIGSVSSSRISRSLFFSLAVLSVAGFRVSLPLVLKMWTGRKNGFY
jgi:uncharacterized protein YwlG (UPF0340 family)